MPDHPNKMTVWPDIRCQRGHTNHRTVGTTINLADHGYGDLAQVPERLRKPFDMMLWNPRLYPVDGGPYCPAHDAVSATILSHRIWEPRETILAAQVCSTAQPGDVMLDLGAQLGWYSLIAASWGLDVWAFEADLDNAQTLRSSAELNGWSEKIDVWVERIADGTKHVDAEHHYRFVKMDLEGAENVAWEMLQPAIENALVDHMMIEVSPVFDDYYPQLVADIVDSGFRAYLLPEKQRPPVDMEHPDLALLPLRIDAQPTEDLKAQVASWSQQDVWFQRIGAEW